MSQSIFKVALLCTFTQSPMAQCIHKHTTSFSLTFADFDLGSRPGPTTGEPADDYDFS